MQENQAENQEKIRLQIERFSPALEKGDIGISKLIDWGYILYGQTKMGKTAAGHYLSGNPLRGFRKDGRDMVDLVTLKNKKARIGNQINSETAVPNFFQVLAKDSTNLPGLTYIVDTPGYGDTSGILKIMSNGYYHYRMYSKVKNMKFILCFDQSHLKSSLKDIINTIVDFTSSFKNYLDQKEEIWKSCAFLITKVNEEQNQQEIFIQNLESIYTLTIVRDQQVVKAIKDFIKFIIKEKRIFYFNKIQSGKTETSGDLLEKIDKKVSKWWSRDMNKDEKKNEVDMEPVRFSLAQRIIETCLQEESKKIYTQLVRYYNNRIKQLLKPPFDEEGKIREKISLKCVLNQLAQDAMNEPSSKNFLDIMESYIKLYYDKFDPDYREEREIKEKKMFAREESGSFQEKKNSQKSIIKEKNYIIKKFKALKQIQKLKQEINNFQIQNQNLRWLQDCEKNIYSIIRQFNKVSYTKNNSIKIIYKFGYLIYRIVEEAKMFHLLIELSSTPAQIRKIKQISNNELIDLKRPLHDFMGQQYQYNREQYTSRRLQEEFVRNFDFTDPRYSKLSINEDLVDFFTGVKIPDLSASQKTKIFQLVLSYSDKILADSPDKLSLQDNSTKKLLLGLSEARKESDTIHSCKGQKDESRKDDFLFIRKITNNLGKVLQHLGEYQLARKVLETIKYVVSVRRLYELQISVVDTQKKNEEGNNKSFNLRMQYCDYLATHLKVQQAIGLLQEMFESAQDYNDIKLVSNKIIELNAKDNNIQTQYQQYLSNQIYFEVYKDDLQQKIKAIAQLELRSRPKSSTINKQ